MKKKPNIIFIHTDSWDGRALGCMGHKSMKNATPGVDALAKRGALFKNAYSSHPICCPSRANMWSGKYTHRIESWNNHKGIDTDTPTFKDELEKAGYLFATKEPGQGGFGKHDYLSGNHTHLARVTAWTATAGIELPVYDSSLQENFRVFSDTKNAHGHDWEQIEKAKEFMRQNKEADQPFFLYVGATSPHPPFNTSEYWLEKIDEDNVEIPPMDNTDHPVIKHQRITKSWKFGFDEKTVRQTRRAYFAKCSETDSMVAELTKLMDELGLDENTYFIFSSDHGELALEHQDWYKMSLYEGSVRIPLVIAGPGIEKGIEVDNIVSLIDLYPTFLDMAGLPPNSDLDGESILPLAQGKTKDSRDCAYACFTGSSINTTEYMLRKGPWKYIVYVNYPSQLFNMEEDSDELNDLSKTEPEVVKEMDKALREIVDYEECHERCVKYCKESFIKWREDAKAGKFSDSTYSRRNREPATTYEDIMDNCYTGFSEEHEKQLQSWAPPR
jgi:arylsulfatase K